MILCFVSLLCILYFDIDIDLMLPATHTHLWAIGNLDGEMKLEHAERTHAQMVTTFKLHTERHRKDMDLNPGPSCCESAHHYTTVPPHPCSPEN